MNYPKADGIILMVACHMGVSYGALKDGGKHRTVVQARQIAMCAVRIMLGLSYPEVGIVFGRHHTTIMSGVARVMRNADLREKFEQVMRRINGGTETSNPS